jgi:hypothetical protein
MEKVSFSAFLHTHNVEFSYLSLTKGILLASFKHLVIPVLLSGHCFNHLTLELNPSMQRCLTSFFTGDFAF